MIPLKGFDFTVLEDPEFKEDAVREEIVAPLLRALESSCRARTASFVADAWNIRTSRSG